MLDPNDPDKAVPIGKTGGQQAEPPQGDTASFAANFVWLATPRRLRRCDGRQRSGSHERRCNSHPLTSRAIVRACGEPLAVVAAAAHKSPTSGI